MDKIIGLDVGDKTIGVALSDALGITAQGVTTIQRIGIRKDCDKVLEIFKEQNCKTIVIGLPKSFSGKDSLQTQKVYEFGKMLENKMRSTNIKGLIAYQDERFTTKMAEAVLIEADVSRKKRKEVIDKQAAVIILQSYLDRLAFIKKQEEST